MNIQGKSQWEFCCEWYSVAEVKHAIADDRNSVLALLRKPTIPTDIRSQEFAEWLTHQCRLAMNKGIDLAERERSES